MIRGGTLGFDVAIAVIAALVLIVVSPGLAWVAIVALLVLIVSGASLLIERLRMRRR